jgi:hypothetical protein
MYAVPANHHLPDEPLTVAVAIGQSKCPRKQLQRHKRKEYLLLQAV